MRPSSERTSTPTPYQRSSVAGAASCAEHQVVDLDHDAVEPRDLAGPQQVVGQRAEQDALAGAQRLVEHALGEVGQRRGQRVRRLAVDESRQQAGQHAQIRSVLRSAR